MNKGGVRFRTQCKTSQIAAFKEQKSEAQLGCVAHYSVSVLGRARCIVLANRGPCWRSTERQEGWKGVTRIHPFDKILSDTPAARNVIKCQLSVLGLTTHAQTHFFPPLSHLKTLSGGRTKEDDGLSRWQRNEPTFSLMTFTENIMGNSERTEGLADYSSARIHAFAAWLMHDGMWQLVLFCFSGSNRDEERLLLWKRGMCRPRGSAVQWKLD